MPFAFYDWFFGVFAFVFGAIVGSFLNVCIYRLPLNLSVNEPKRSFCPNCKTQIPWYYNLPVFSWLWLRGRCSHCHQPIAVRYPLVELLTAVLFVLIWQHFRGGEWILILPYWIFIALVIVATFIDFDHFMIPDEITLGSVAAGVLLSAAIPQMQSTESRPVSLLWSLIGAAVGYATLRLVVEAGKLVFGRKRVVLPEPRAFTWQRQATGEDAELTIDGEVDLWSDFFSREKDRLMLYCDALVFEGKEQGATVLACYYDHIDLAGQSYSLDAIEPFAGTLREYIIPREAMGLGDVKFIAGIGAFLGWQAVFFTIAAGSLVGSVFGIALIVLGPKVRSLKVPFGPYLSVGAILWIFAGPALVRWYLGLMHG